MVEGRGRRAVGLELEGIRKRFGAAVALEGIRLHVPAGSLTTLLGPSGCGKTTLLRIIAGFVAPDEGRVRIGGEDVGSRPPWRRRIGFVFQSYALWPHMTASANIAYGLKLRRLPRAEVADRVAGALERVGMAGMGDRYPGQLSGGQQQRVALARALVLEPDVLLLDEPLSSLDARLRVEMRREIRRLQREMGITTVYVTHDQEEALELSDLVAVMSQGRIEQLGTPDEVYHHPRSAFVARFLCSATVLEGRAEADGSLRVAGRRIALGLPLGLAGKVVRVAIRPEDVALSRGGNGPLPATVIDRGYLGHVWKVVARVAEGLDLVAHSREAVALGDTVSLRPGACAVVGEEEGR